MRESSEQPSEGAQDYLSPRQVAQRLGVGIDKVKAWMAEGLRYSDLGYRTHRIKIDWLEAFVNTRARGGMDSSDGPSREANQGPDALRGL